MTWTESMREKGRPSDTPSAAFLWPAGLSMPFAWHIRRRQIYTQKGLVATSSIVSILFFAAFNDSVYLLAGGELS